MRNLAWLDVPSVETQLVLADRYRVVGEIAKGGCGAVFDAVDTHSARPVAIKVLHPSPTDRAAGPRFAREARVASSIHHPNVCAVLESGVLEDGTAFLVLERLYGETLRAYLARLGARPAEEAIEVAVQMLSGLEAAHALGIVHRDMKPENVFMARTSVAPFTVKLLDFGMCRWTTGRPVDEATLTRAGSVVGTPEYMAPEQASGRRNFDLRIDLYAVGVILFELLTGSRAFRGPDPKTILLNVLTRGLPSVRSLRPEVAFVLDRIVARAAERDPNARYHDAAEFQHDLLEARTELRRQRADERRGDRVSAPGRSYLGDEDLPTREMPAAARLRRL